MYVCMYMYPVFGYTCGFTVLGSVLRMLLSVSKQNFNFANKCRSFEKGNLCLLTEFHHLTRVVPSLRK